MKKTGKRWVTRMSFNVYFDTDGFPIELANKDSIAQQILADLAGHGINGLRGFALIKIDNFEE